MSKELKHKIYSATECLSEQTMFAYIDNKLDPKERHLVEKHMLDCELCSDALEGLELVKDRSRISVINKLIDEQTLPAAEKEAKIISINYRTIFSVAAGIALLIGGVFFFNHFTSSEMKSADVAELTKQENTPSPPPPPPPAITPADDAPDLQSQQGPATKFSASKNAEGKSQTYKDLEQSVAADEDIQQSSGESFKNVVAGTGTKAPGNAGDLESVTKEDNVSGLIITDAVTKQEDGNYNAAPSESSANIPRTIISEKEKKASLDESKKAEEKSAAQNTIATTAPSYSSTTSAASPNKNQDQKNDKSNGERDEEIVLAKKTGKENNRADSKGKDKNKSITDKENKVTEEEVSGKIAYEPKTPDLSDNDKKEVVKTETPVAVGGIVLDNTVAEGSSKADSVYSFAETMPVYPGGDAEMKKFITKNFKYSKLSAAEGTKIIVQFTVDKDGSIKKPLILKGINAQLNKEALRVVSLMPKFIPGKNNGKPVALLYNLPITLQVK